MVKTKIRRTTLILVFLISLLGGLYVSQFTRPLAVSWLALVLMFCPLLFGSKKVILVYLILAGSLIGWWRGGILQAQTQTYKDNYYKNVQVIGRATEDSFYADKSQMQFMIESVQINGQKVSGKIQIRGYGEAMIYRHDIVAAKGNLYPSRGSKQANISFATIDVLARTTSRIEDFRRNFIAGMETALPEPSASFAIGLLVGQRSLMSDEVAAVLVIVGLTHIVAVSGYNLTIIVQATKRVLGRLSRFQILIISMLLIYLFLLVTGFSPSIIRATIVSILGLLAWYFGRQFRPILLILLAAAITGFINPYYPWGDVGWYLSFLAFTGVLVLAPLIMARFFGDKKVPLVAMVAIESFSAQLLTLPYIMLIFGRISLVGLIANIVVVPLVPLAMLFSLFAGLAGMLAPAISGWIALPARILLNIMLWLSSWFAKWPSAQIKASISIGSLIFLYLVILIVIIGLRRRSLSVTIKAKQTK